MTLNSRKKLALLLLVFVVLTPLNISHAEDNPDRTIKSAKGLNFNVPPDWPLEDRGGSLSPIPVEEYLIMKFKKSDERFKQMEARLDLQSENFTKRIAALEEQITAIDNRLENLENWLINGDSRTRG